MIHTARQSPKFMKLVRRLRPLVGQIIVDADSIAVCVLEKLWHATTVGAIRGDIGKFDNETIAEMCGWLGDADELVTMLVETGYLDVHPDPEIRLLVHDWHDHAPKHVKGNVTKVGGFLFLPKQGDAPKAQPIGDAPKAPPLTTGAPNLTNSNLTNPIQDLSSSGDDASETESPKDPETDDGETADDDVATVTPDDVMDFWNASGAEKKIRERTLERRKKIKTRLRDPTWPWREAISKLPIENTDRFTWQPDIDWLIRNGTNAVALVEGRFDNRSTAGAGTTYNRSAKFGEGF